MPPEAAQCAHEVNGENAGPSTAEGAHQKGPYRGHGPLSLAGPELEKFEDA